MQFEELKKNEVNENTNEDAVMVEAIDLGDLETLEEGFAPVSATGCGCGSGC